MYLSRQKQTMNETFIFFKIVSLAFSTFTAVNFSLNLLFWYSVKLHEHISFHVLHILKLHPWDEFFQFSKIYLELVYWGFGTCVIQCFPKTVVSIIKYQNCLQFFFKISTNSCRYCDAKDLLLSQNGTLFRTCEDGAGWHLIPCRISPLSEFFLGHIRTGILCGGLFMARLTAAGKGFQISHYPHTHQGH